MSFGYSIVCRTCGSYRMEEIAKPKITIKRLFPLRYGFIHRYHCGSRGDEFEVKDLEEYTKQHPPNLRRCSRCDKEGVELVERNHQYPGQAKGEVADLHKCSHCGHEIHMIVQLSPYVLY